MALKVAYMTLPKRAGGRRQNVGDRVIHLGVRNIMRCALGPHEAAEVDLASDDPIPGDADVLVVCGTPQIADMHQVVDTVRRTAEAAEAKVPVRINLGAGAFYFDAFGPDLAGRDAAFAGLVQRSRAAAAYARYSGFDLCVTRDMAATAALRRLGVPAVPLPCPGFFAALFQPRPAVRWPQPLVSVLNGGVSFWNRVTGDVHAFYARLHEQHPDAVFIAHDEEDCEMLADFGIPHVAFDDAEALVETLAAHDRLLSLRVHSALPAWTLGLDTTLLGLDRRALLGEDFGASFRVLPLRTETDLRRGAAAVAGARPAQDDATRSAWLSRNLGLYVDAVRATVSAALGPLPPPGDAPRPARPAPAMLVEPGRYWTSVFHSTEAVFDVPADLLRSHYPGAEADADALRFTTDGADRTLVFGPYLRLPHGRWRVEARITAEPPEGTPDGTASPPPELVFSVMKGEPMELLARGGVAPPPAGAPQPPPFDLLFRNPRDTGLLETVLRSARGPLPAGWRFRVGAPRFYRLG